MRALIVATILQEYLEEADDEVGERPHILIKLRSRPHE
jgi:hypothetical protein